MTSILRANDQAHGRNNYERLLSGIRPTESCNPYECHDPNVLTVPRSYKRLKYVQDLDALLQTTNYLQSLPGFKWTALSIIRCDGPKGDEAHNACETIQIATANESFVIDARMCKTVVATEVLCRFLTLLFTTGTRFGFCFDEADREQIAALVNGNSVAEMMCRTTIRHSLVYDVRQLIDKLHENPMGNANETDGLARTLELPNYVRNLPRLSHYVHHITKKKLNKAYACWPWSARPYLEEQLAYAHTDVICIILLLERCSKMPALRTSLKTLFGEEALREIDLDIANIGN
ncbi:hypothetical protein AAVH_27234 [Aphelenchoides avenae]|nr:hypothetical protein AAVH_27234 [Aphelenchus avenae]